MKEKIMTNHTRNNFKSHPFHLVSPSPWPIFTSGSLLIVTTSGVLTMHAFSYSQDFLYMALLLIITSMSFWFKDVISEATYLSNHTSALQTYLIRVFNSLEWVLHTPPKPHVFVSLPVQSIIGGSHTIIVGTATVAMANIAYSLLVFFGLSAIVYSGLVTETLVGAADAALLETDVPFVANRDWEDVFNQFQEYEFLERPNVREMIQNNPQLGELFRTYRIVNQERLIQAADAYAYVETQPDGSHTTTIHPYNIELTTDRDLLTSSYPHLRANIDSLYNMVEEHNSLPQDDSQGITRLQLLRLIVWQLKNIIQIICPRNSFAFTLMGPGDFSATGTAPGPGNFMYDPYPRQ